MRLLLTILILFNTNTNAQIKSVRGISESGKDAIYDVRYLPTTNVVTTSLRNKADSLKNVYRLVNDLVRRNKVLTDSIKILSKKDTVILDYPLGSYKDIHRKQHLKIEK